MQNTEKAAKDVRTPSGASRTVPRVGIVQVRMGAERLPGKPLLTDGKGTSLLAHVLERVARARTIDQWIVATSTNPSDDRLVAHIPKDFSMWRGPEQDVLQRFLDACSGLQEALVVRVCADNPFIDPGFMDQLVEAHLRQWETTDYYSYMLSDGTPAILTSIGLFAETVKLSALKRAGEETSAPEDREHVTRWFYTHRERFSCRFLPVPQSIEGQGVRLTVDSPQDLECFRALTAEIASRKIPWATLENLLSILHERQDLLETMAEEDRKYRKV